MLTGVGLKKTLKRKLSDAGVYGHEEVRLADKMSGYLLRSKADSTVKKYTGSFQLFEHFCLQHDMSSKPALPITVAMYFTSLIDEGKSAAFYGIKWVHSINDFSDPTENNIVKQLLECAKRLNSKPVQKKDVLSAEMLQSLCTMYDKCTNVIDLRDLCIIMLSFSGFLRISETLELRCRVISFQNDHLSVNIRSGKTDIYRNGSEILVAQSCTSACPVALLKRYIDKANLSCESEEYLFKPGFCSNQKVS